MKFMDTGYVYGVSVEGEAGVKGAKLDRVRSDKFRDRR